VEITKTFYASERETWRAWLKEHYKSEKEIWLVYYRKQAGKPRISYNDAVEEALCFGWIDSTVKAIDADRIAQKFSPRRAGSAYSQPNKERLRRLIRRGKVIKGIAASVGDILADEFAFPADILIELKANKRAWDNFRGYSGSYQRIRVAFIDTARRRPGEYEKRLHHFIRMTERNKQYGYGIETYL